jgi:hypothetical protein
MHSAKLKKNAAQQISIPPMQQHKFVQISQIADKSNCAKLSNHQE